MEPSAELVRLAAEIAASRTRLAAVREKLSEARGCIEEGLRRLGVPEATQPAVSEGTPAPGLTQEEAKTG